ncbi:MAG: transcription antitermination factor NusB [Dehalococcoidia bacterium]
MSDNVMRRARYLVIESLYEADTSKHAAEDVYNRRIGDAAEAEPDLAGPGPSGFGRGILRGVVKRCDELDRYIQDGATRYPVETMAVVDRNILRLAIWELLTDNSAPVAAVINEAVELAHRYGGDSSPGFINGVLRTVSERIQAAQAASIAPIEALPPTPTSQEY